MSDTTGCTAKHAKIDPSPDEWKCPWCGAGNDNFWIDESANGSGDCERLHDDDYAHCYACNRGLTGKQFAARIMKAKNLECCPTCKGKGVVPAAPPRATEGR